MIDRLSQAAGRTVSRETVERLQCYESLLIEENKRQNLVSASTLANFWERHIADSAQLVRYEPGPGASWVDIGSGAGLPGVVIACLVTGPVTLVEPRRLRAEFLHNCSHALHLDVRIVCDRVERLDGAFDVITARAVAQLPKLLEISAHLSTGKSRWVLPKGRNVDAELAATKRAWQGVFHVEPSQTDPEARIVVANQVRAKA